MDKSIYFPGLNGIRAIAALIVVIWHTDQFARLFQLEKIGYHENGMAGNAVDMFFVLSGFLITYLLLVEKEKTGTIDLKKFYMRRILRIWPLYYFALIVSVLLIYFNIIPEIEQFSDSILLYLFFMANVAYVLGFAISSITPLWSVGVEEQFYLIWPHIVKRTTKYIRVFLFFCIIFILLKISIYLIFTPSSKIFMFMSYTRIDIMGMGAVGAYLVYSNSKWLKIIYRKEIQILAWLALCISVFYHPLHVISFADKEINAIIYFILILNVSTNKETLVTLENKFMNYLGKVSYGIYVYHMIVIYVISSMLLSFQIELSPFVIYPGIVLLTIGISALSYKYFETPFLKLKRKHTLINSSNSIESDLND
jgi:peptidoglycan/LPS O-acetylase OafA/YrhL